MHRFAAAAVLLGLALLGLPLACSSADAQPLDVTYYYLPG
jgi:hypothetical protein